MDIIYEPKGKAKEYSELAINLYEGCLHACKYCYCPEIRHKTLEEWSRNPHPRENIIHQLENNAKKRHFRETREVLLCFMSDPYQSDEAALVTRQALLILEKYQFQKVNILTKAGFRAMNDFDILKRNGWKYGSTIIFNYEKSREEWEPSAPSIQSRIDAVRYAHSQGIFTWVSVEPVIYPDESVQVIKQLLPYVDFWKVGKLNHFPNIEKDIDWKSFYQEVKSLIPDEKVYYKFDLRHTAKSMLIY